MYWNRKKRVSDDGAERLIKHVRKKVTRAGKPIPVLSARDVRKITKVDSEKAAFRLVEELKDRNILQSRAIFLPREGGSKFIDVTLGIEAR